MYTEFYRLKGPPFQLTPDHRFYFGSSVHKKALGYLVYGLHQGEGFIVITGEVGSGKTTLVSYLLSTLAQQSRFVAANVVTTALGPAALLRMVASAFGIPEQGADKATLLLSIESFLASNRSKGRRCLLFVDEAQNLSVQALEELRMLSNFQLDQQALLQSFLLGQPQFRRTLASAELDQLRQRVIATCHLGPMSAEEIGRYIEHRLRTVDWNNDPEFTDEAFQEIHSHTGGLPRRINILCSRLLVFGFLEGLHRLDGEAVRQVAKDMTDESGGSLDRPEAGGERGPEEATRTRLAEDAGASAPRPNRGADISDLRGRLDAVEAKLRRHEDILRQSQKPTIDYDVDADGNDPL